MIDGSRHLADDIRQICVDVSGTRPQPHDDEVPGRDDDGVLPHGPGSPEGVLRGSGKLAATIEPEEPQEPEEPAEPGE